MQVLKNLRISREMTQQELSEKIGIRQQTINKYETGLTEPKLSSLVKMADFFHTTIDYLAGRSVPYSSEREYIVCEETLAVCNYTEAHLLHLYRQAPDEVKQHIVGFLQSFSEAQKKTGVQK